MASEARRGEAKMSLTSLSGQATETEALPFSHQDSSPTSPCIFGPIGPPSRHGATESRPTSYPSTGVLNTSRGGSGSVSMMAMAAREAADNGGTARQRRMEIELGTNLLGHSQGQAESHQRQRQRQRRSEELARLDHLRL